MSAGDAEPWDGAELRDVAEPPARTVHATCIVVGEVGLLLHGPSGSGKSSLARELVDLASSRRVFARLVADDRVRVEPRGGRLVARSVPRLAGLLEIRGIGIVRVPFAPACVLRWVMDMAGPAETVPRLPDPTDARVTLHGVPVRHARLPREGAAVLALALVRGFHDTPVTDV